MHATAGPALQSVGVTPGAGLEVGYRFAGGDVLSATVAYRGRPVAVWAPSRGEPEVGREGVRTTTVTASLGLGLRRLAPSDAVAQHLELGVGAGVAWFDGGTVGGVVELHPRLVVPSARGLSVALGSVVAIPVGVPPGAGAFVGGSLGLRIGTRRPNVVGPEVR